MYVKPSKCQFVYEQIRFVGHIVGNGRRRIDQSRIMDIAATPTPKDASEVRRFCGVVNYLRDHIPNASDFMGPLYDLTKKNARFEWAPHHQAAFVKAKAEN